MKLLAGCIVSSGLLLAAWSAHAQALADGAGRLRAVSDFEEPYGEVPPAPPPYVPPPYAPPPYGYAPALMPPHEVYAVLRDNGFLPLGIPRRLGSVYEIAARGPDGEDGRLIIDGRTGRIVRFTPAYWGGRRDDSDLRAPYDAQDALPQPTAVRGVPRPPALIPHVASHAMPRPAPKRAAAAQSAEPAQQSTRKPADAPAQVQARATTPAPGTTGRAVEVKPPVPVSVIRPTEAMPPMQGLE
jgi:hypothetical protein